MTIFIPGSRIKEFKKIFDQHRSMTLTMQILYDHIRLLTMKHKIMDRSAYQQFYFNICKDVELETPPMDIFMPGDEDGTIQINRDIPEWSKIKTRISKEDLFENLPLTHPVYIYAKDNVGEFEVLIDDALIHWSTFKYLAEIEKLMMSSYMNGTPLIEWMCGGDAITDDTGNIAKEAVARGMTKEMFKSYLVSDKIKQEKIDKNQHMVDICFPPNLLRCKEFYLQITKEGEVDRDFSHFEKLNLRPFDIENLMLRFSSNNVLKSDKYILLGTYLILSFSLPDILNIEKFDVTPPCIKYIQEVLSQV